MPKGALPAVGPEICKLPLINNLVGLVVVEFAVGKAIERRSCH